MVTSSETNITDYLFGFQHKTPPSGVGGLQFFPHAEGYVNATKIGTGYTFKHVFNYTDHLGNIRLSYSDTNNNNVITTNEILEENHYYPFGLKHSGYNTNNSQPSYKYKFQGQERQDELGLNWDSFKWRNYDYAIGRFMSIDPLAEDYVYNGTYNFAENKVVNSRELEGLEAWESNKLWDEKTIEKYRDYASKRADYYRNNGSEHTCEDLAINILIDYGSQNKLPLFFENGTGMYYSSDKDFKGVEDYRNSVLKTTGATDLTNNTIDTSNYDLNKGDLILHMNEEGRINHTQVVTYADSEVVEINQGNFKSAPSIIINNSSDPQSSRYIGTEVQTGIFLRGNGNYYRDGNKTDGLLNSNVTQGRTWNFNLFNFRESLINPKK